ncbi:MAG: hypothetical protein Q7S82_01145 [bacterium]|nr:hypothetical protein [bacterium]
MDKKTKIFLSLVIVAIIAAGGIFLFTKTGKGPDKMEEFAKCLTEKKAVFYGAFWCSHCQNQKTMFGNSEKFLPYVECSTPDGKGQVSACQEKQIQGYPTWEFQDGSRESGEVSLGALAEKTGCVLQK